VSAEGAARAGEASDAPSDSLRLAFAAVRRRARSSAEVREWLARRGFGEEEIATTIERLEAMGELDDARFARLFAEDKRELSDWGPERIREALLARGVGIEHVEAALDADSYDRQLARARELLERKGADLESDVARGRALGFLTRRGYEYDVAYEAVRRHARAA
jgi:regulatory protein